ncbi:hypothetical protein MKEN_00598400 [Mycena kentingensis (nom. inval.)]|nr:hypothetical protein MKEN_00598400 [Mycena kentingensis (nom. inval.)]
MHSFLSFPLSLLLLATSVASICSSEFSCDPTTPDLDLAARGSAECTSELSCEPIYLHNRKPEPEEHSSWMSKARALLSNAERLQRRLPLKTPARRNPTRVANAARTESSPVPLTTYTGYIQVIDAVHNLVLGFVSPDPNYWAPEIRYASDVGLIVSFQLPAGATSGTKLDFTQINDARGPFFGLVVGRDSADSNIGNNFHYLYFTPISASTGPGSPPQPTPNYFSVSSGLLKESETGVWSVDVTTGDLSVQWVNEDGPLYTTQTFLQSNHLYAGGNPSAFQSRYPSPITNVRLKFIPM